MNDKDVKNEGRQSRPGSDSIQSIMGWIGGKKQLRAKIANFVPEQDVPIRNRKIKYYVEVFGGMAWMLLFKPRWFEFEIYNDFNDELVNLFRVVRFHPNEFYRQLKYVPKSRTEYSDRVNCAEPTDILKAVATYIKYAWSFSSTGNSIKYQPDNRTELLRKIIRLSDRLQTVVLTNDSYEKVIDRFDRDNCFLYLDPPYFDKENLYHVTIGKADHINIRDLLKHYKGKFLLSYNDCDEIRKLYIDFRIETVSTVYTAMMGDKNCNARELLIMNY